MLRIIAALALTTMTMLPAPAQSMTDGQRRTVQTVRVQVSVNFFIPGPANDTDESARARDRARRSVYEMANGECKALLEILADECRLESINVNINRQTQHQAGQPVEGMMVHGSAAFRISQK